MYSNNLPSITEVKRKYNINFDNYSILMYHPVTTEVELLKNNISEVVDAVIESNRNYIVIYPNNDKGSDIILKEYKRFENNNKFLIYPSMRFEYFLTLLKECDFIIGNSSSGIREASVYGRVAIDIGTRQSGRYDENISNIIHTNENKENIISCINKINNIKANYISHFGEGNSDEKLLNILCDNDIWNYKIQKRFIDRIF